MNFKEEFARRKALVKADKEGITLEDDVVEQVELKQSQQIDSNPSVLRFIFITSLLFNVVSLTVVKDWFHFLGSVEYTVWKMRTVDGAIVKDYDKKEKIYKKNLKRMIKENSK